MSKSIPSGYPLPTVINPGTFRYVCVPVPDDPGHRQAFSGAIYSLTRWFSWEGDPLKQGKLAAQVWMPIFFDVASQLDEDLAGCGLQAVRQNPEDLCELQYSDDGSTWVTFATISLCEHDHPEYVAINPNTIDRNLIQPSVDGVYPLQLKQFSGSGIDVIRIFDNANGLSWKVDSNGKMKFIKPLAVDALAAGELSSIYAGFNTVSSGNGTLTYQPRLNFGHAWIGGTASVVRKMTLSAAGRLGIGENLTAANLLAYLHVFPTLSSEIGAIIRAAASQTANLLELHTSANLFLSGIDNLGRFIFAVGSGKPTDTIGVKPGTTRIDASAKKLWVKGANPGTDDWFALEEQPDPCCIENVEITMIDAGSTPIGSVDGDTLNLQIPYTEVPTPANYWFKFREDRPDPGETKTFELVCLADGFTIFPCEIQEYDVIVISNLSGWWSDISFDPTGSGSRPVGYSGQGVRFDTLLQYTDVTDPRPDLPHMCALFEWQRGDGSYTSEELSVTGFSLNDVNSVAPFGRIYPNNAVFDGSPGGIQFSVSITASVAPIITCAFAGFVSGTHGFILKPSSELPEFAITGFDPEDVQGGLWVLGEGFESTEEIQTDNPTQTSEIVAIKGTFDAPLTGSHRYTFTFELSGVVGADINIRGQRAHKPTGLSWVLGNMSHAVFYGNGTHEVVFDGDDSEAVGLLLHTIPTASANDWKITIKQFDCEAL